MNKKYTIEAYVGDGWKLILGIPQRFASRAQAVERLRHESQTIPPRRCRLVNGRGITVLHAGVTRVTPE